MAAHITATETIGQRLEARRKGLDMSLNYVVIQLSRLLPEQKWITGQTLRNIENGSVTKVDPVLLLALAAVYGVPLRELSAEAADACDVLWDLFGVPAPEDGPEGAPPGIRTQNLRDKAPAHLRALAPLPPVRIDAARPAGIETPRPRKSAA